MHDLPPASVTVITVHETLDGKLPKPNPILARGARKYVNCTDWQCVQCTPKANNEKMGGRSLRGVLE